MRDFKPFGDARGFSLVIVLWVIAILMVIVTEFAFTVRVESGAVRNYKDEVLARELSIGGINRAVSEISEDYAAVTLDDEGRLVFQKRVEGVLRAVKAQREFDMGEGRVSYAIEDERGKLNINIATREMVGVMLRNAGVQEGDRDTIAASLMDWRDENHEFHLNGAEDDYYSDLPEPYEAKDGLLTTVEELLLLKGVTPEVYYGTGRVPPGYQVREDAANSYDGISRQITVYGDGKININTAGETVLEAMIGKGKAQEVLLRRDTEGFFLIPEYGGVVSSDLFSIVSSGDVRGLKVTTRAIIERRAKGVVISYWNEEGAGAD